MTEQTAKTKPNVTIEQFNQMMHFNNRDGEGILTPLDYEMLQFIVDMFAPINEKTKGQK